MRGDVIEIRTRGEILLVGGAGTLSDLSADLRGRSLGASAIRGLGGDTQAIHHLRHFWLRRSHPQTIALASERGLLDTVATAAAHGDVDVVVLPSHHARPRRAEPPPGAAAPTAARVTIRAGIAAGGGGAGPPGAPRPLTIRPRAAPPSALAVNRMPLDERLAEVLRRAAGRLPGAMGDELLALVTPESIAVALGLAAFGAAANLTPFGWAGDAILAAVAFGFGGLAAIRALGDLVFCFRRIFDAQSERDLDEAADALARAASAITVAGLAAILHQKAKRGGGGGGGKKSNASSNPTDPRGAAHGNASRQPKNASTGDGGQGSADRAKDIRSGQARGSKNDHSPASQVSDPSTTPVDSEPSKYISQPLSPTASPKMTSPQLNRGQQEKHIPGTNNFDPQKSILDHPDPQKLLDKHAGTTKSLNSIPLGQPGSRERVDFGEVIGRYRNQKSNILTPTTKGVIHYGSRGAHIVPSRP